MNIRMLGDKLLVLPEAAEEKTKGGLFLPEAAKQRPSRGRVYAAGPGKRSNSGELLLMDFFPGDIVLYSQYAGYEIELDGTTYLVLSEGDIFCKLK